jgi:transcriptional regulator with XRE-family HTH domain
MSFVKAAERKDFMENNKQVPYLFGKRMARLRKAIGASPGELAKMIPLSSHLIYRYEAGNYGSHPRTDKAKKIADFFGVSLNWLLSPEDDTDKPFPFDPEPLKEIKSRYYLRRALENSGIGEDKIPEALEELQRMLRLLVRWSGKS